MIVLLVLQLILRADAFHSVIASAPPISSLFGAPARSPPLDTAVKGTLSARIAAARTSKAAAKSAIAEAAATVGPSTRAPTKAWAIEASELAIKEAPVAAKAAPTKAWATEATELAIKEAPAEAPEAATTANARTKAELAIASFIAPAQPSTGSSSTYSFLDCGNGMRLETFGGVRVSRSCPTTAKTAPLDATSWKEPDLEYSGMSGKTGVWSEELADGNWTVRFDESFFSLSTAAMGQVCIKP
jgi:hypothetical protein